METLIKVENLSKAFGKTQALDQVSFEVRKGEIVGFIGPNGAGKSTAIRILLGLIKADKGRVEIFGQDVWKEAVDIHRRVAYVPGDVNLWPNLTGGEVIDLFLSLRGIAVDRKRKEDLIRRFEFDPTKKCRAYSKGNRQKVALIAAFAAKADVYIFDEPTSGLDPLQEQVFQECTKEALEKGASVLLSSHILSEVEKLCDKVVIIRQGNIVEAGSLDDLRHLTRVLISLKTVEALPDLDKQPFVHDFHMKKGEYIFQLDSDHLNDLLAYLQPFTVTQFESAPPKLEDLFMRHYESTRGGV
ncbi:ABC-type multidrug transport system, ATPase component [Alkalibacterium sp. AK22]|uniref:ABC transporter ATP-binding protein n=1 Tax=Alkalibacterium sp. AK22 TaxID=1229520 RepID=UPI0004455611|nr:ABC transporter ATP-binding protein [Alkalibacterium sp. AK22]EXJ24472.1 ABC-type multidrug transport system, ATPase component [Alkalibacterium sp. AK22]